MNQKEKKSFFQYLGGRLFEENLIVLVYRLSDMQIQAVMSGLRGEIFRTATLTTSAAYDLHVRIVTSYCCVHYAPTSRAPHLLSQGTGNGRRLDY